MKCICTEAEGISKSPEEQIDRMFNKGEEEEKLTVI